MNKLWSRVHGLKTLSIELAGWMDISPALIANPSLEELTLNNLIPPLSTVSDRMQLPNLRCVKLSNITALVSEVTRSFVAPNLQVLHLFSIGLSRDVLREFAQADPPPALRELRLGSCTTSVGSLKIILAGSPLLETLQISKIHGVVNDVLRFIADTSANDNHQDVCPSLKHVDLSNCADLLTGSAYSLVKTRLRTDQPVTGDESQPTSRAEIESLKLDGCPNIEAEMLSWFREKVKVFSCVYMSKTEANRRR
jgi:F-box/TPR repeat protein Pof3